VILERSWESSLTTRTYSLGGGPLKYNAVQYSTVQYSTVQYSTVQYSIVLSCLTSRRAAILERS